MKGVQDTISDREVENLEGAIRKNAEGEYEITFGVSSKTHNTGGLNCRKDRNSPKQLQAVLKGEKEYNRKAVKQNA